MGNLTTTSATFDEAAKSFTDYVDRYRYEKVYRDMYGVQRGTWAKQAAVPGPVAVAVGLFAGLMAWRMERIKTVARLAAGALLLAFALPASAGGFDAPPERVPSYRFEERVQIPVRIASNGQVRYVASMMPLAAALPLFQVIPVVAGGGGSIISGTTTITGGATTQVCYNQAGTLKCGDAGLTYVEGTDTLTVVTLTPVNITRWLSPVDTGFVFGTADATTNNSIQMRSELTPDSVALMSGSTSETWHVYSYADVGFDFANGRAGTAANTNPSLILHSGDQVVTEYLQLNADTTGAAHLQSNLAEVTVGGFKTNFTEGSAQVIARITMPSGGVFGATVTYTVSDSDGTDHVGRSGNIVIQGANKAGTSVCTINASRDTEAEDGSQIVNAAAAFTLTYTWTNVVNTTSCDLSLNAASSAGANTLDIQYTVLLQGNSNAITVTPIP